MTFVKNAIAGTRKEVVIQENLRNNGASKMVESNLQTGTMESVQTVLLSDLYDEAKLTSKSEQQGDRKGTSFAFCLVEQYPDHRRLTFI